MLGVDLGNRLKRFNLQKKRKKENVLNYTIGYAILCTNPYLVHEIDIY